ncbi:VanZ family protein [Streptomyces sp. RKND-216]|uniref:VanZ family protein n=1 Tax=Streptomyces sp. RKND-216 TaxID=2562581 RepID=UPI00109E2E00|nr:VanZ family protein [Streptomyces sp. RKND-216]THA26250.1 VanZ family protein [Streptomyces sp. RKND-216]
MFSAIFKEQTAFIVVASLAVLLVAAAGYFLAHRHAERAWSWAILGAAVAAEVALTLFLSGGRGNSSTGKCVVNHDFAEPFATTQGILNLALFVPIGIFGVLASRRLLPVLAGGIALTVATEFLQTLLPGVSRGCDSSDLQMNALGAVTGALATYGILRASGRAVKPAGAAAKPTALGGLAVLLPAAVVWNLWITPVHVDATSLQGPDDAQRTAAEKAVSRAFDDHQEVVKIQFSPGVAGGPEALLIALESGSARLSWPDTSRFTATLEASNRTTNGSFPIEGAKRKPGNEQDAEEIARRYAERRYPWATPDAKVQVNPMGELGWIVSWRRLNSDGVLLPMRLDVQINTEGRVSQLLVNDIKDPKSLPAPTLSEKKASSIARKSVHVPKEIVLTAQRCALRATKRNGNWRTDWVCPFQTNDPDFMVAPIHVDAVTGKAHKTQGPQELQR